MSIPLPEPDEFEELGPIIVAGFDSPCSAGDLIIEGDSIRADGEGGWVHVECAEL